jgi:uncharacterized protein involved in copper resistance
MKQQFAVLSFSILLGWPIMASGQSTPAQNPQQVNELPSSRKPGTQDQMPGMQHDIRGMQQNQATQQTDNPAAERTSPGPPVSDLLKQVAARPAMQLNQFEDFAL